MEVNMLRRLFLAPGYFLYRRFSRQRKKFRFVSKSHERGPALRLALLFWFCAAIACSLAYGALAGREAPPATALPAEALAPFPSALAEAPAGDPASAAPEPPPAPALPSMAESARLQEPAPPPAPPAPPPASALAQGAAQAGSGPPAGGAAAVAAAGPAPVVTAGTLPPPPPP
ncbi:MAG: hypothetical protein LBG06_11645, partial [Deltaproteobacteria bacterium]|nr:hypothetical protein [Deltaproteobacteria bacterium]